MRAPVFTEPWQLEWLLGPIIRHRDLSLTLTDPALDLRPKLPGSLACLLEEVPSAKTLQVHEVVVKDLTNMAGLITKAHDTGKDKTPGLEEE